MVTEGVSWHIRGPGACKNRARSRTRTGVWICERPQQDVPLQPRIVFSQSPRAGGWPGASILVPRGRVLVVCRQGHCALLPFCSHVSLRVTTRKRGTFRVFGCQGPHQLRVVGVAAALTCGRRHVACNSVSGWCIWLHLFMLESALVLPRLPARGRCFGGPFWSSPMPPSEHDHVRLWGQRHALARMCGCTRTHLYRRAGVHAACHERRHTSVARFCKRLPLGWTCYVRL
jgi:hypothetical protein